MSRNVSRPKASVVRLGFIEQSDDLVPQTVIWLDEAPDWVRVPDNMERFPRQPPAPVSN